MTAQPQQFNWQDWFIPTSSMILLAMAVPIVIKSFESPEEELANLNFRIARLAGHVDQQRESIADSRKYRAQYMKEHGLTITPPVAEMVRRFHPLYHLEINIKKAEEDLKRMEVSLMWMQKRRKELMQKLGLREEDMPVRRVYPAMKKFIPPRRRE